ESPASFEVRLSARSETVRGTSAVIGFAEGARAGRDAFDRTALPAIGEGVSVRVAEAGEVLARSLKPEGAEGQTWDIEVSVSEGVLRGGARRVSVALDEEGERPPGFGRYVNVISFGPALMLVRRDY